MGDKEYKKGGSFLLEDSTPEDVFTPEDFTEEHRMIRDSTRKFVESDVMPKVAELEKLDYEASRALLKAAGEMGLLGIELPEEYGGADMDKITAILVGEEMGRTGSFSVTMGAHSGIGTLPVVYYGTPEQKAKYLPKLATAEFVGAYALTEPGSGSDALSAKCKAVLSDDKTHFVLNGTKQFITNAGFADVFIVFAKIDGEAHSAFIVEKGFEGVSVGKEEKKLGIKGSSTAALNLENAKVPSENLLGKPGDGVKIALNILNIGRFKLGAWCLGVSKQVISDALEYTSQREQFGKSINQFGLIQEKLANMAVRTFVGESASYRTVGLIQKLVDSIDKKADDAGRKTLKSIEEYSIECAIMKVLGSEILDYVADEGLQCLGGYGYVQEYPMERVYRDSRINRIFEGTNEINRLVITGMLMKKGLKGELKLMQSIKTIQGEMTELPAMKEETGELLESEKRILAGAKKAALLIAGAAVQKFEKAVEEQQEILAIVADCMILIYSLESIILRSVKIAGARGEDKAGLYLDIARIYCSESVPKIDSRLKDAAAAVYEGDELRVLLAALRRFMKYVPPNVIEKRRNIAKHLIEAGRYQL